MTGEFNRRDFLALGLALTAASSAARVDAGHDGDSATSTSQAQRAGTTASRKIGSLAVSPVGLGCMNMVAGFYNPAPPRQEMVALIRSAVERGVTFFDTAEVYGPFSSEEIVGEALAPFKGKVTIASKFGFAFDGNRTSGRSSRPEAIKRATEGSLNRLRVEAIDLYYLHRVDPTVPIEDVAGTVKELIQAGKIRHFGLSEASPATIRRAHAVQPVAALQTEYSLLERIAETQILATCEELGIAFVPWGPTARAMLTGNFNAFSRFDRADRRASVPYFAPEALEANMAVVALARTWARRKGITPVQFALGWLLAQKPWIVPIPGTTQLHHLDENLGSRAVRFSPEELQQIRGDLSKIAPQGVRAPESVGRDL